MRILLTVDGSDHSSEAEKSLRSLFCGNDHQVDIVYVAPPVVHSENPKDPTFSEVLQKAGMDMLDKVEQGFKGCANLTVKPFLLNNASPATEILNHLKKNKYDVVIMGARGQTPLKRFFLGSVSQSVSRQAPTSAMIVRPRPIQKKWRILIPVDGSPFSDYSLRFLSDMGVPPDSELTLFYVVPDPIVMWMGGQEETLSDYSDISYKEYMAKFRKEGENVLKKTKNILKEKFPQVKISLAQGHVVKEILHEAEVQGTDLIVLGHRGLSPLQEFFMGSVSQKVSAYATCSVLVVHQPGK